MPWLGAVAGAIGSAIGTGAGAVGSAVGSAAGAVGSAAGAVGSAVAEGAAAVGGAIGQGAGAIAEGVGSLFGSGGGAIAEAMTPVVEGVAEGTSTVASNVAELGNLGGTNFAAVGGESGVPGWSGGQLEAAMQTPTPEASALGRPELAQPHSGTPHSPSVGLEPGSVPTGEPTFWQNFSKQMKSGAQDVLGKARESLPQSPEDFMEFMQGATGGEDGYKGSPAARIVPTRARREPMGKIRFGKGMESLIGSIVAQQQQAGR